MDTRLKPGILPEAQRQAEVLYFVIGMVFIFIMAARTPLDSDMWWHLRAGEETILSGRPVVTDTLSYTMYGAPWTNHSWLAEVVMWASFRAGEYWGLLTLFTLLIVLAMGLVYAQTPGPGLLKVAVLILSALVAAPTWSPRPQVFSFALFALISLMLNSYSNRKRWLGWLPLLFVAWSNLHGGYPLGLALLFCVIAGDFLQFFLESRQEIIQPWKPFFRTLVGIVLCVCAVLINPNGIETWLVPFKTIGVGALQQSIPEWASPDFHDIVQQPLLWVFFSIFALTGLFGIKLRGRELVCLLVFGWMAFLARRNYGPFAIIAAPVFARLLVQAGQKLRSADFALHPLISKIALRFQFSSKPLPTLLRKTINLTLVGLCFTAALVKLYTAGHPVLVNYYLETMFPAKNVQWIQQQQIHGRILNEYQWGGYLTWTLRENLVFLDGRTDLFGDRLINEWNDLIEARSGWEEALETRGTVLVLLEPERNLVKTLLAKGWIQRGRDSVSILLQKP